MKSKFLNLITHLTLKLALIICASLFFSDLSQAQYSCAPLFTTHYEIPSGWENRLYGYPRRLSMAVDNFFTGAFREYKVNRSLHEKYMERLSRRSEPKLLSPTGTSFRNYLIARVNELVDLHRLKGPFL